MSEFPFLSAKNRDGAGGGGGGGEESESTF